MKSGKGKGEGEKRDGKERGERGQRSGEVMGERRREQSNEERWKNKMSGERERRPQPKVLFWPTKKEQVLLLLLLLLLLFHMFSNPENWVYVENVPERLSNQNFRDVFSDYNALKAKVGWRKKTFLGNAGMQ